MEKSIFIFAFFLSTLALLIFFLFPKYQQVLILRKQIEHKRAILDSRERYFLNLKKLEERLENYEESLKRVNSIPSQNPDFPSLFNFLQKSASEAGLVLEGIDSFQIEQKKERLGEAKASLSLLGSYSSLKKFLLKLERSARLIGVKSLSFSSPKGDIFHFDLEIKVNFLK